MTEGQRVRKMAAADYSNQIKPGLKGRYNFGLYCEGCDKFLTLAILPAPPLQETRCVSGGLITMTCPRCRWFQMRPASDLFGLMLNDINEQLVPDRSQLH